MTKKGNNIPGRGKSMTKGLRLEEAQAQRRNVSWGAGNHHEGFGIPTWIPTYIPQHILQPGAPKTCDLREQPHPYWALMAPPGAQESSKANHRGQNTRTVQRTYKVYPTLLKTLQASVAGGSLWLELRLEAKD